jgi:outer membrane protein OmpA-like peptidoglycan-associated protein
MTQKERKEHFMKTINILILVAVVGLLAGCATVTPMELINARAAYQSASAGPAAQLVPADLHKAHEALDLAEKSFEKDSDSYKTKDLAYVAQRKAQLAVALSSIAADKASKTKADADFQAKQTEIVKETKAELSAALAALAAKEEARGTVITLSGSVLFQSAQSTLLPSAQAKLNEVGNALAEVGERNVIVEGYTDSQGSDSYNQGLSQRRADAVRNYLVQRGYPANSITSLGMGEGSPIADNTSSEGRANNRRVEIIIQKTTSASR